MSSYWETLRIAPTRDQTAIKRAYADLAKIYHPEEHPEEFQKLRQAYQQAMSYARKDGGVFEKRVFEAEKRAATVSQPKTVTEKAPEAAPDAEKAAQQQAEKTLGQEEKTAEQAEKAAEQTEKTAEQPEKPATEPPEEAEKAPVFKASLPPKHSEKPKAEKHRPRKPDEHTKSFTKRPASYEEEPLYDFDKTGQQDKWKKNKRGESGSAPPKAQFEKNHRQTYRKGAPGARPAIPYAGTAQQDSEFDFIGSIRAAKERAKKEKQEKAEEPPGAGETSPAPQAMNTALPPPAFGGIPPFPPAGGAWYPNVPSEKTVKRALFRQRWRLPVIWAIILAICILRACVGQFLKTYF